MILMFIVYSNAVDEEIVEIALKCAGGYTKFLGVPGEGGGEPHLGTHVWPSVNNCIMIAIDRTKEDSIVNEVKELKKRFSGVGISIFSTNLRQTA